MIEEGIYFIVPTFVIAILFFFLISGRELRPKTIFDVYAHLYLLLASMVSLHAYLFVAGAATTTFILVYFVSFASFTVLFFLSSLYFNNRLRNKFHGLGINNGLYERGDANIGEMYSLRYVNLMFFISIPFAILSLNNSYDRFVSIDDLHGGNAEYLINNYFAKIVYYIQFILIVPSTYYILYIFCGPRKSIYKSTLATIFILVLFVTAAMSPSRAGILNFFLPIGLVSFYLSYFARDKFRKIVRLQIVLLSISLLYVFLLGVKSDNGGLVAISFVIERVFLTSDVALWYHLYGALNPNDFNAYNIGYFAHPFMRVLGINSTINGLGIEIARLAGSMDQGKGPIPTFIYDAYLTSNNIAFTVAYSCLLGVAIPFVRYLAISRILSKNFKIKYLFISVIAYFMSAGPAGDYLLFISTVIPLVVLSMFFYILLKLRV